MEKNGKGYKLMYIVLMVNSSADLVNVCCFTGTYYFHVQLYI